MSLEHEIEDVGSESAVEETVSGVDMPADENHPGDEAILTLGALGVAPGAFEISGTTKRNFRAQCLVIPKQQGALIDITSIENGDEVFTLGAQSNQQGGTGATTGTPGTDFAEYGSCTNVVMNSCITTGQPVTIKGVNKSLTATDIQATFRGTKMAKNACPPK